MNNFSVLISVYKEDDESQFKKALDSIFNNSIQSKDVVLIVDGPINISLRKIINFFKKRYIALNICYLSENKGLSNALNIGLELCKFNIVFRADADDINKHDRFKKQLSFINKGYDLVGSWIDEFHGYSYVSTRKVPENCKEIYQLAKFRSPLNHQSVCFKKDKINKLGGYEDIPYHEDYLLWAKCIKAGLKFYNIQESLVNAEIGNGFIKRRSGFKYIYSDFRMNYRLYKYGINSFLKFIIISTIRFIFFNSPTFLKKIIYKFLLRD